MTFGELFPSGWPTSVHRPGAFHNDFSDVQT